MFGAGTNAFSQPQNRRILRPPGRGAQEFALAESACSGVGGAVERREFRQKFLERSCITVGAKGISSLVPPQRRNLTIDGRPQ